MAGSIDRYVALLRGINVGGKNVIRMTDLRDCFVELGYDDVQTYIQSGNVLFSASGAAGRLTRAIETGLAKRFKYDASVVLRSRRQLREVVDLAPVGYGKAPEKFRYDVLFLKEPLTAKQALPQLPQRPGVDTASAGEGVLYCTRLIAKASQSRLAKLSGVPLYRQLTIRNWNTTTKLLEMLDGE